ncbi:peptidoglycan-binding domain-containing protein [Roseivivax sp. THAF30]|uniref:peptidoglycan-binding domain-containing protein n=1 Tax=Roseivivax sp. THAF30 TaxID=2587852 RepID=UPI001268CA78|nr:peptidoglycan-binding domain-containing protein [Roseivivax sp. THAF30]QFT64765.1 Putative peptidoglycan binding domain protein [Roseivivax sp. THAF30]
MRRLTLTLATCLWTTSALADSAALLVENAAPSVLDRLRGSDGVAAAVTPLREAGVDVLALRGADGAEMREGLGRFIETLDPETDRVAIVLSGRFVNTGRETYLLPADGEADADAIFADAMPLSPLLAILGDYPGQAVLMLAEGAPNALDARFLKDGAGRFELPQGVTLIRGAPDMIARLARQDLATPARTIVATAREENLGVEGFAPSSFAFLPAARPPEPEPDRPEEPQDLPQVSDAEAELRLWEDVSARDDADAYELYLKAFPSGPNAGAARDRLAAIEAEPGREARLTEETLELTREERSEIQRDLSLLDYNTRGIDGIFGPGTRSAIEAWQEARGFEVTSYLTGAQIDRLDDQAAERAEELEREAAAREAERARNDRAYWQQTGASGEEADLRAYLERYPDGDYADLAEDEIGEIEAARAEAAARQDRQAWATAEETDTTGAYRQYLSDYPEGAFAEQAERRLSQLEQPSEERQAEAQAQAEEAALNLSPMARRLAEAKLASLDLGPGRIDGSFDGDTRRAIRRYQDSRGLGVTGYLDQPTVVRLLADSILR